ncbi:hypothetical protein Z949_1416 [Sulfitobacter guttiformis KCTC 32187]|nr:hypothetical protein Z949_1416 [Sulfitobacter guttiformis KCTC 32187]
MIEYCLIDFERRGYAASPFSIFPKAYNHAFITFYNPAASRASRVAA